MAGCCTRCRLGAAAEHRLGSLEITTAAPTPATIARLDPPVPAANRDCPHCGGESTIVALLTTPEAAHLTIPGDGVVPLCRWLTTTLIPLGKMI